MLEGSDLRLPLLLVDRVLFPCNELRLDLDGALLRALLLTPPDHRWLGVVLARPTRRGSGATIYPAGTAARVLELAPVGEGANVHLVGARRFEVTSAPDEDPYPLARVRLLPEPALDERSPALVALRRELTEKLDVARQALGTALPLGADDLHRLASAPLEELVNAVADAVDVPPLRKLELLTLPLPDRALEITGILRSRIKLVALLHPYRHLAAASERN